MTSISLCCITVNIANFEVVNELHMREVILVLPVGNYVE